MTEWEYYVLRCNDFIAPRDEERMNQLGKEGFELVNTYPLDKEKRVAYFIFKRPKELTK